MGVLESRLLKRTYRAAIGVVLAGLGACGGPGSGVGSKPKGGSLPGFAYVTTASNGVVANGAVFQFAIGVDGSVTPLSNSRVSTGVNPTAVVADPTGHFVFVANQSDTTISQYTVGADGGLSPLSPAVVSVSQPYPQVASYSMAVDPTGNFLYAVAAPPPYPGPTGLTGIAQYAIQSDGTLKPLTPNRMNLTGSTRGPLVIDSSGHYAYLPIVNAALAAVVAQFSIAGDGTLQPLSPALVTITTPQQPIPGLAGMTIAADGKTAYFLGECLSANCSGGVSPYNIGASGELTPIGTTALTGPHAFPLALISNAAGSSAYLLVDSMGVDTNSDAIYRYSIDTTGSLIGGTLTSLPVSPGSIVARTYGANLYVLSANSVGFSSGSPSGGYIDHFSTAADGTLMAAGSVPITANYPTDLTLVTAQ